MADSRVLDDLIERFISERLTADELPGFFAFLEEEGFRMRYAERIDLDFIQETWMGWSNSRQADRVYNDILQAGNIPVSEGSRLNAVMRNMEQARPAGVSRYLRYAAAVLALLAGALVYRYANRQPAEMAYTAVVTQASAVVKDIPPGGHKAILILGDHSVLSLDSLARGSSLTVGGMKIIKTQKGEIRYVPANTDRNAPVVTNTVRTPRGGQYQVTLSDGTRVWLNAASSITYPTRFTGAQRTVRVSGEAYFEVAENREKPFIVDINDSNKVEVLGTHFNVNAYEDEAAITTTLLQGKVRVVCARDAAILIPGQQSSGTRVNNAVDLGQVMAWRTGVFSFENKNLPELLRELARWYDLTIVYENGIPDAQPRGEMGMNLNLSQVIKGLKDLDVHCRLEAGNKLVVSR